MSRVFYTFVCPTGGVKLTPQISRVLWHLRTNFNSYTRDVKASRPVWPRSLCGLEAKLFGLGLVVSGLGLGFGLVASGLGLI